MLKEMKMEEMMSVNGGTTDMGSGGGACTPPPANVTSIACENMVSPGGGGISGHLFEAVR